MQQGILVRKRENTTVPLYDVILIISTVASCVCSRRQFPIHFFNEPRYTCNGKNSASDIW
jgi:hypothetical protein